ncbi:MAG: mannonate dehydratase [Thermomicrobiales bacterium]|nr:mannonate dehydratase [Thermomicrobiales bacterium]
MSVQDEGLMPVVAPAWEPSGGLPGLRITDVRPILTAPDGIRLIVVKVETSEPGLYGVGCAGFTTRPLAVATAIEQYLKPLVIGRDPNDIEDIWQVGNLSGYWRSGPVLNNALSGIDMALWDIKGKRAGMPVYQLLGGKVRKAAAVYSHASGRDFREVEEQAIRLREEGFRYIRCQVDVPGNATYGVGDADSDDPYPPHFRLRQGTWNFSAYTRVVPRLFDYLRSRLGEEVELLHDIHERLPPMLAIGLAKELERFRLFFLEDPFAPEDSGYFPLLRQQTATPIAMGELYVNQAEYMPLIQNRLIDFIRCHVSAIGGITPARKLAAYGEFFGVRTAWHGPGDVSPIGHAANLQLDLSCANFGIQECFRFGEAAREVFPGTPEIRDGYLWSNERPGLGIDVDEERAAKYPAPGHPLNGSLVEVRQPDGTVIRW